MTSFHARKTILIHPAERAIQQELSGGSPRLTDQQLSACAISLWEFDRIYYYLVQERTPSRNTEPLVESLAQEFERVRAVDGGASAEEAVQAAVR